MKKSVKIAILIASLLCVVGVAVCATGLFKINFDFSQLNTQESQTKTYEITEDFENLSIQTETADVIFALSEDDSCRVVCQELAKVTHSVEVQNGTLVIKAEDSRRWYDHIGIVFDSLKVTVYLPKTEYHNITVETDTGDVEMPGDFKFGETCVDTDTGDVFWGANVFGSLKIGTDTGDITLASMAVIKPLKIETDTGDICLDEVWAVSIQIESETGDVELCRTVASDSISVKTDTGDVEFDHSDAASIFVETDTGDVEGSLFSEKIFFTESDTGDIHVPHGTSGGRCEIRTDTGDIEIEIVK
ncbi:MAG: DUF4097 family beta strand repeat protein [Clostridia bacterium]|nr:DUF4097 family beta strand repeat protein [Clostridia bacterium]